MAWNGLVALIGMSGAGKSTLGKALAPRLGLPFLDIDSAIQESAGMSVRSIFEIEGELGFRERERQAIEKALAGPASVVAIGAGAVAHAPSQKIMLGAAWFPHRPWVNPQGFAIFAWLDASDQEIVGRLGAAGGRPLLDGSMSEALARQRLAREPLYGELAGLRGRGGRSGLVAMREMLAQAAALVTKD